MKTKICSLALTLIGMFTSYSAFAGEPSVDCWDGSFADTKAVVENAQWNPDYVTVRLKSGDQSIFKDIIQQNISEYVWGPAKVSFSLKKEDCQVNPDSSFTCDVKAVQDGNPDDQSSGGLFKVSFRQDSENEVIRTQFIKNLTLKASYIPSEPDPINVHDPREVRKLALDLNFVPLFSDGRVENARSLHLEFPVDGQNKCLYQGNNEPKK